MENDSMHRATAIAVFVARAGDPAAAERLCAEAWEAGAVGIEERDGDDAVELVIYAPAAAISAVRAAVAAAPEVVSVGDTESVPETDWSEGWKTGLAAIEISPRLLLRPSFVAHAPSPGQVELLIDPGQAFGTGSHASTRLVLEWIDAIAGELPPRPRVLDVGTGTGVLALSAIALVGATAVAFDVDPLAVAAARQNAAANGIVSGFHLFVGSLGALCATQFDLVVANLLKSELVPLIDGIAAATRAGGLAVFSGLLASDATELGGAFARAGFESVGARSCDDASGESWTALLMRR